MQDNNPAQPSKWGDLGVRTLSAVVLIPVALAAVWAGGTWFVLLVAIMGVLTAYEWTTIAHAGSEPQFALHAASALAGAVLTMGYGPGLAVVAIAILWVMSAVVAARQQAAGTKWQFLGVPYAGLPAAALVLLRGDPAFGLAAIVWVLVIVWSADVLAYFAGRIIGGPKLAPVLSPKKTWAGLGGAVCGSAVASTIFLSFAGTGGIIPLALVAGGLALVEQAGDIFESALKRHFGIKDSGCLIPGHGGVMDRIDGLVAVAAVAAVIGIVRGGGAATGAGLLAW
jgi:phosphatidate cytidylyltransferase